MYINTVSACLLGSFNQAISYIRIQYSTNIFFHGRLVIRSSISYATIFEPAVDSEHVLIHFGSIGKPKNVTRMNASNQTATTTNAQPVIIFPFMVADMAF